MNRCLSLFLVSLFMSAFTYGQVSKMIPYIDSSHRIAISYPENWEVKQVPGRVFTFSSPQVQKKDFATASINLVIVPVDSLGKHITNKNVLGILETAYQNEFANYKKIKSEPLLLNGYDGIRLFFQGELEHYKLKFITWAFIYNKNAYVFTCKTRFTTFEQYSPTFDKILEHFKINNNIQYQPYIDSAFGVVMRHPSDWQKVKDSSLLFAFYSPVQPPHDYSDASVSVLIAAAENASLKNLQSQMQDVCAKGYKNFKKIKSENLNVNKHQGIKLLFSGSKEGIPLEVMLSGFLINGKAYLITCATRESFFEQYHPIFDTMLNSFNTLGILMYDTYNDTTNKISIRYPQGWQRAEIPGTLLTLSSPRLPMQNYADASMNLVIAQEDISLTDLMPQLENAYPSQVEHYEKIKSEMSTVNGNKCIRLNFKGEKNHSKLHFMSYTLQHNDKIYSFTCVSSEASFGEYQSVFEKMITSFKIN